MWRSLLGGLINIAGTLVGRVLIALGLSVVTYTGMDAALEWLKGMAVDYMAGFPTHMLGMLALLKVGTCISLAFSAMAARMVVQGLTSGSFKRWVTR